MRQTLPALLLAGVVLGAPVRAEDWATTDGKSYQDVKVLKVDADVVTILYQDGGATVPLETLPPYLQTRFKYDPAKAKAAALARTQADKDSITALQAEKDKMNAAKLAAAQAVAKAADDGQKNATNNALKPTPPQNDPLQTHGDKIDPPRDIDRTDPRTHHTGI